MREDIAARYRDLTNNPQKIVYSTIPIEERTDYLPARHQLSSGARPVVYDADGFSLSDDVLKSGDEFVVPASDRAGQTAVSGAAAEMPASPPGPDKPRSVTPGGKPSAETTGSATTESAAEAAAPRSRSASTDSGTVDPEDLLSIAMQEEREGRRRRGEKIAERQKKQMLVPCSCGAWIRVLEDQAGKVVRCRQCKNAVQVPEIRRKTDKKDAKATVPQLAITWINDVWFHSVNPTALVLKPGSLTDKHTEADIALTDSGLHVVTYGGDKKKKGGLSFGGAKKSDVAAARNSVRAHVAATGQLKDLPDAGLRSIDKDSLSTVKLVQPVAKAHESMFAGVPVFGEGRIAVYLPLAGDGGEQTFCSFPLSAWRVFAERLNGLFAITLPAAANGVPDSDKADTALCFVNQSKVESIRNLLYYQKDPGYELELSGCRCKSCSVVISEDARMKKKLGSANGKGIAKAKCPKCSQKMGEDLLYRIKKAPESLKPAE
jgi:hypothetical protein